MDCFSSSFKNCSWSWLVFSMRVSFEVGDTSPMPSETFSFKRTSTSTGLVSSKFSFTGSIEVVIGVATPFSFGASATEGEAFSASTWFVAELLVSIEDEGRDWFVFSLLSISAVARFLEAVSSITEVGILSLVAGIGSAVFSSVAAVSGTTTEGSTTEGVGTIVSAETAEPIRKVPIKTEATPIAYLRMEKRCCRWNSIKTPFYTLG